MPYYDIINITIILNVIFFNFKIFILDDGRSGDSSLVVSLEINGTNYQGVLFAQSAKRRSS